MIKALMFVAAVITHGHLVGLAMIAPPAIYDHCADCSLLARQMAWSIDKQPEKWTTDGYRLSRFDGPSVWVANEAYGIGVGPTPITAGASQLDNKSDRELLWRAYQRWLQTAVPRGASAASTD